MARSPLNVQSRAEKTEPAQSETNSRMPRDGGSCRRNTRWLRDCADAKEIAKRTIVSVNVKLPHLLIDVGAASSIRYKACRTSLRRYRTGHSPVANIAEPARWNPRRQF